MTTAPARPRRRFDSSFKLRAAQMVYGREVLDMKVFDPTQVVPEAVDEKTLNARVDQAVQRIHAPKRPAADHPWRRWEGVNRPDHHGFIASALRLNAPPLGGVGLRPAPPRGESNPSTEHFYLAQHADISIWP